MLTRAAVWVWVWVCVMALMACSDASGSGATVCVPGRVVSCPCPGGEGTQVCADDGARFGACVCGAADAGADIVTVADSASGADSRSRAWTRRRTRTRAGTL